MRKIFHRDAHTAVRKAAVTVNCTFPTFFMWDSGCADEWQRSQETMTDRKGE